MSARHIAVQSGLANSESAFTVTLLNSSVDNAFAIPGGYVYVTRQLVSLMNNEAELAGVLGHEVGHVAARHSKSRQRAAPAQQHPRRARFDSLGRPARKLRARASSASRSFRRRRRLLTA